MNYEEYLTKGTEESFRSNPDKYSKEIEGLQEDIDNWKEYIESPMTGEEEKRSAMVEIVICKEKIEDYKRAL